MSCKKINPKFVLIKTNCLYVYAIPTQNFTFNECYKENFDKNNQTDNYYN